MTVKHDMGKLRWMFIPWDAMQEVAKVYTWGHVVKKYGEENWKTVEPHSRYADALMRHFVDWILGKRNDDESGLFTLAHLIFNALCLLWFDLRNCTKSVKNHGEELLKVSKDMANDNKFSEFANCENCETESVEDFKFHHIAPHQNVDEKFQCATCKKRKTSCVKPQFKRNDFKYFEV
jgi:hypothetical protein